MPSLHIGVNKDSNSDRVLVTILGHAMQAELQDKLQTLTIHSEHVFWSRQIARLYLPPPANFHSRAPSKNSIQEDS